MTLRPFALLTLLVPSLFAEPIKVSPELFRTPEFRKRFVGSYGFLPEVEPKVDQEEARLIAELAEYLSVGQFKEAEKRLLQFIKERRNPVDPEAEAKDVSAALVFTLGNLYLQNNRPQEAESAYKTAIKRFPEYRRAHKNLAMLYARTDRMKLAKPHLLKAIDLGDTDHLSFGVMGHALLAEENALQAESAFRQAALLNPEEKDWKIGLVQALLIKEDWGQAASLLQTLINENPNDPLLWLQQANCYLQMDKVMQAAENYEILRLKGLADEAALNTLGDLYANQKQPLLALGAYLGAMRLGETVKVGRSLKSAEYLLQLEAPDEAAKFLAEVRAKGGDEFTKDQKVQALIIDSDIAVAKKDLAKATSHLKEALELDLLSGATRVKLGLIYLEQAASAEAEEAGKLKVEARAEFSQAARDADKKVAYNANRELAQMFVKNQQYLEAIPLIEESLRLKDGNKASLELYLRRVQRAAERQKAREERLELERKAKNEELDKFNAKEAEEKAKADQEKKDAEAAKKNPKE
ncbi:MAG: tetratricopeptide repeat protein [Akkermansiaceae bacterium]|jgi:tetratricopeptide (TPR) repeat protein